MTGARGRFGKNATRATVLFAALVTLGLVALLVSSTSVPVISTPRSSELRSMFPGDLCQGESWNTSHLLVETGGCQAFFTIDYSPNSSYWIGPGAYNLSFSIPWIAEINTSGGLVELASPLSVASWTASVISTPNEVNVTLNQTINVTAASGEWIPNDTGFGSGPQWSIGAPVVGTVVFVVTFHLLNVTSSSSASAAQNTTYSVKFDMWTAHWPWASSADQLGIGLTSLGVEGSHFAYNATNRSLADISNATGQSFVSLVFGNQAGTYAGGGQLENASVGLQAGLFTAANPLREAVALLSFDGVPGGYFNLAYDPWVDFSPGSSVTTPPPSHNAPIAPDYGFLTGVIAAGSLAAVAAASVVVIRRRRLRREGEELVQGMNRVIRGEGKPPDRP